MFISVALANWMNSSLRIPTRLFPFFWLNTATTSDGFLRLCVYYYKETKLVCRPYPPELLSA
jgi:hypothetical protein